MLSISLWHKKSVEYEVNILKILVCYTKYCVIVITHNFNCYYDCNNNYEPINRFKLYNTYKKV